MIIIPEFYRFYVEEELILWKPFMSFRFSFPKTTEITKNPSHVMISVGREVKQNIDKEKLTILPSDIQKKVTTKYTLETYTKPAITISNKFVNRVIKTYLGIDKKVRKVLGLHATKEQNRFEIYQYAKFKKVDELLPVLYGIFMSLGVLAHMEKKNKSQLASVISDVNKKAIYFVNKGLEKAKEEGWR